MKRVISLIMVLSIITVFFGGCNNKARFGVAPNHRLQWWLEDIGCSKMYSILSGKNVSIAIIDGGVDATHPDLKKSDIVEININDTKLSSDGAKNHGTSVAGIICAYPSDENGMLGIAPSAKIISIDITDKSNGYVEEEKLIIGIKEAIKQKVDIINMSIGMSEASEKLHDAVKEAYDAGIILIASAGNGMNNKILFPAAYKEVIAVGAKSKDGEYVSPSGEDGKKQCLFLPGKDIMSVSSQGGYRGYSGTSVSCALLTGMVALKLEKCNGKTMQRKLYRKLKKMYGQNEISVFDIL